MADSAATPLVGRSIELDRVRAAIERAFAGVGGTLLIAGEEGIGKSRLAAEALVLARQRGFLTLSGTAYALHADLAYAPVLEAIGPFLAGAPAGRLGQLVRGLPDLSRLFGMSLLRPQSRWETRLWSARGSLKRSPAWWSGSRLTARLPLWIDDLHWADHASLDLLHYLARGVADQRLLLLGTYRLDEARPSLGCARSCGQLQRLGLAEEITLTPLRADAVAKLAAAVLDGKPPETLLSFLHDRAAGSPLYITALIRGMRDGGELFRSGDAWAVGSASLSAVPPVVHDLVLDRLERLNTGERTVVELMAVAGDAASPALLRKSLRNAGGRTRCRRASPR